MDQDNIEHPARERSTFKQREIHRCPHCAKQYTTSTWLDNHIKIKHMTRGDQGRPGISTDFGVIQLSQYPPESHSSALVTDLQKLSSSLKQFTSLIDDIVPRLQEFGEASLRSCSIDRSHLQNLKRRAPSPDLREREGLSRTGISAYSSGVPAPQASEPVRGDEPRPQKIGPVTTSFDNHRCKMNESDYSLRIAPHASPRHTQQSRLLLPQGKAPYSPMLGNEFPQQQLHEESTQESKPQKQTDNVKQLEQVPGHQNDSSPIRHDLALILPDTTQPPDAQLLQSLDMSYPKLNKRDSTTQTMQHYPDSSSLDFSFGLGDGFDSLLQDCAFPSDLLTVDSTNAFDLAVQSRESPKKEDDPLSEYMN